MNYFSLYSIKSLFSYIHNFKHAKLKNTNQIQQCSVAIIFKIENSTLMKEKKHLKSSLYDLHENISKQKKNNHKPNETLKAQEKAANKLDILNKNPAFSRMCENNENRNNGESLFLDELSSVIGSHLNFGSIEKNEMIQPILNISPSLKFLLIKRSHNIRDLHSQQLAFPGGKCEDNESDFDTVLRETEEEIGVSLNDENHFLYIGKIPINYFAYFRKGKKRYISVHIFLSLNPEKIIFKINNLEVEKIIWASMDTFIKGEVHNLKKIRRNAFSNNIFHKNEIVFNFIKKFVGKGIICKELSCIVVEDESFYGITFYIMINLLTIIYEKMDKSLTMFSKELNNIQKFRKEALKVEFLYHRETSLIEARKLCLHFFYHFNRINQYNKIK